MQHCPRVIALFSGKGGVGKSFISLHLAKALAESGQRTLLLDLDLQMGGTLATMLQVRPTYDFTYMDAVGVHHVVVPIQSRLDFISAPTRLDRAVSAQKDDLTAVIAKLQQSYEWLVIDLANRFDLATVSALSAAHWVWFVTTPDQLARSQTEVAIHRLESLGLARHRMRVVANCLAKRIKAPWMGLNTYSIPYDERVRIEGREGWNVSDTCMKRLGWIVHSLVGDATSGAPTRAPVAVARAGHHVPTQMAR